MKLEHNAQILDKRKVALEATGAFRKPLPGAVKKTLRRGYQAKYGSVDQLREINGSTVVATDGSTVDIKLIKAVPSSSGQPPDISEDNQRLQKKRDKLYDMMEIIQEFVGAREISLRSLATHLAKHRFLWMANRKPTKNYYVAKAFLGSVLWRMP